eukprot:TRINITY_DN1224_c0_g1_i3.p1 TRINITY_DN1224_c0_g1~~TRINITY_DN1224_c0_g1_i3.p1  ORF type:complete len:741 (-),score=112.64 TRINITY_DN1224_c0_g1_i3:121-2343(-)
MHKGLFVVALCLTFLVIDGKEPLGKISIWSGIPGKIPAGWELCAGQVRNSTEEPELFQLLGNLFGSSGTDTFLLPDLMDRFVMSESGTYPTGISGGEPTHNLTVDEIPSHSHELNVNTGFETSSSPQGKILANFMVGSMFHDSPVDTALAAISISPTGGSYAHQNMSPYLGLHFIICTNISICQPQPADSIPIEPIAAIEYFPYQREISAELPLYSPVNAQTLPITADTTELYSVIGNTFGGTPNQSFALPNMTGRFLLGTGTGPGLSFRTFAEIGGAESVTLTAAQIPTHGHKVMATSSAGQSNSPSNSVLADGAPYRAAEEASMTILRPDSVASVGGNQPHNNLPPFISLSAAMQTNKDNTNQQDSTTIPMGRITFVATDINQRPPGWMPCNGTLLPISRYNELFKTFGTTYGGDGRTTFGLPDLRGRGALGAGGSTRLGQKGGTESITLTTAHLPLHTHTLNATNSAADNVTSNLTILAQALNAYSTIGNNLVELADAALSDRGGSQAHTNMPPFIVMTPFICALPAGCSRSSFDCFDVPHAPAVETNPKIECIRQGVFGVAEDAVIGTGGSIDEEIQIDGSLDVGMDAIVEFSLTGSLVISGCVEWKGQILLSHNETLLTGETLEFSLMQFNCASEPLFPTVDVTNVPVDECDEASVSTINSRTSFSVLVSSESSDKCDEGGDGDNNELFALFSLLAICVVVVLIVVVIVVGLLILRMKHKKTIAYLQSGGSAGLA